MTFLHTFVMGRESISFAQTPVVSLRMIVGLSADRSPLRATPADCIAREQVPVNIKRRGFCPHRDSS